MKTIPMNCSSCVCVCVLTHCLAWYRWSVLGVNCLNGEKPKILTIIYLLSYVNSILEVKSNFWILPKKHLSFISANSSLKIFTLYLTVMLWWRFVIYQHLQSDFKRGGCQLFSRDEFQVKVTCFGIIPIAKVPWEKFVSELHWIFIRI